MKLVIKRRGFLASLLSLFAPSTAPAALPPIKAFKGEQTDWKISGGIYSPVYDNPASPDRKLLRVEELDILDFWQGSEADLEAAIERWSNRPEMQAWRNGGYKNNH